MTRTTLLAGLAIVSLLLAVPTAAVALGGSDTTEAVELTPKSQYATVESGELTLDFDRLNADATTRVDAVFAVTVRGETAESLWIDHDVAGLTFYADGDPSREIDAGSPLALESGDSGTVGVSIDTRAAPTGEKAFSIVVASEGDGKLVGDRRGDGPPARTAPESLVVTNASADATNVTVGEPVSVTATVSNRGDRPASGQVSLFVDETVVDDRRVALAPGETRSVTFTWTAGEAGVRELRVESVPAGTVAVSDGAGVALDSIDLSSPLTAAVAPPATLGLLAAGRVVRGRRR